MIDLIARTYVKSLKVPFPFHYTTMPCTSLLHTPPYYTALLYTAISNTKLNLTDYNAVFNINLCNTKVYITTRPRHCAAPHSNVQHYTIRPVKFQFMHRILIYF